MASEKIRKYEVVSAINLGGKNGIREPGSEIATTELRPEELAALLATGRLRDADAPIPPSQAEGIAAFDRIANLAQKLGVLRREGSAYRLGEITATGLTAFRAAVTVEQIEAAILKAFNR